MGTKLYQLAELRIVPAEILLACEDTNLALQQISFKCYGADELGSRWSVWVTKSPSNKIELHAIADSWEDAVCSALYEYWDKYYHPEIKEQDPRWVSERIKFLVGGD
ncbi:MAG: hypothetical protein GWN00_01445 [Aliifodinibius sp.]|nr:hypothetical protein [Phycisphaerae bacterium]NIR62344.1 hypothetical protein [candidate division Zixibacteria bacterium]NIT54943.1 hypothetical protein [Fodinibius sp.]NIW43356.1 hypothetical protein [Gammaproteobacteria bacterium]NIU12577.1 hypothetical protein [candidate division Zixibacteria bacterium]